MQRSQLPMAEQETEEALKQYLKDNPELQEIAAATSAAKKKRRAGINPKSI